MSSGQPIASPAELGEAGIPKIIEDPSAVPEARAIYSSNPAFTDGASTIPDGIVDIEIAVIKDEVGKNINGREEEIEHAIRFMRFNEGGEETGEGFVIINHQLALKGLRFIRKNVKVKEIRQAAIESRVALNNQIDEQQTALDNHQARPNPGNHGNVEPSGPAKKSRSAIEREEKERQKQALIQKHREAKSIEEAAFSEWREENPHKDKPKADPYSALDTTINSRGEIVVFQKSNYDSLVMNYLQELAEDPQRLSVEFRQGVVEQGFLRENDMQIILAMTKYSAERASQVWDGLSYADPEELLARLPKWLSVFAGFSDEYRNSISVTNFALDNREAKMSEGDPQIDAYVHDYGFKILFKSLIRMAEEYPEEFLDTVYEILQQTVDTGDELIRKTMLLGLSGTISQSYLARMSIIDAPLAPGLDRTQKLKAMDIELLMENEECVVAESTKKPRRIIPRKFARQYEARTTARENNIDVRKKGWLARLSQMVTPPLVQAVKAEELPDSLYLKVKEQKENLPEDA